MKKLFNCGNIDKIKKVTDSLELVAVAVDELTKHCTTPAVVELLQQTIAKQLPGCVSYGQKYDEKMNCMNYYITPLFND